VTGNHTNKKTVTSRGILVCLILIVATLFVYGQVGTFEFVAFDDHDYVTDNNQVQAGLTPESITYAFTATRVSNWHPLTWLSHMLDCELFGLDGGRHHLINVLFHLANTLLLFFVLRRMSGAVWRSGFVAALFALHPLHVESVAWVSERKDVLSTFFWILTMWGYTRYVEDPGIKRYLLVLLFFALGLMAKPMLVTLPFVLLLMDYWPLGRIEMRRSDSGTKLHPKSTFLRLLVEKTPLFVLAAASCIVTFLVQQGGGALRSLHGLPLNARVANAFVSYLSYIGKMFWPYRLAFFYPHPGMAPGWQFASAGVMFIAISLLAVRAVRRRPYFAVGWLWYVGTLVPVIGLVQVGRQAMADRYTYVPLIGLFIIVAWGVPELVARWCYRKVGLAVAVTALLSILAATTWVQVGYWQNSITLFERALEVTRNNYLAHNNLGVALFERGNTQEAVFHYQETLRIEPDYARAHSNLGLALSAQGKAEEAISHLSVALRLDPNNLDARNNFGLALFEKGDVQQAIPHYREVLRVRPDHVKAHNNLGLALSAQGKVEEAISHLSEAVRFRPDFHQAHNNLGMVLFKKGRLQEAIFHFRETLRIKPDYPLAQQNLKMALAIVGTGKDYQAKVQERNKPVSKNAVKHYKLGNLHKARGKLDNAATEYQRALSIRPGFTDAMNNLALVYVSKGEHDKALPLYMKLIELEPESYVVYYNLACMYARQNKAGQSIDWLREAVKRGFTDWDHLKDDDDLKNIRGTVYFKELVGGR
jgi:tetratricopeptide (TPR) repeat protein